MSGLRSRGKKLYQGAKEGRESWALCRKRDMGKEDERMSLSRWMFWQGRMREFHERAEVVASAGRKAEERMKTLV